MMRSTRSTGGQAIVEATLGIIVFVTILMFGIHFTEITFTQMKVTEAAQAAVWESTAGKMHTVPLSYSEVNGRVAAAEADANNRYQDFDGSLTGPGFPKQIFSTARYGSMDVKCRVGVGMSQNGAGFLLRPWEFLAYRDNDGMQCTSEAWIDTGGVSGIGRFLEGANGFFRADASHKRSATATNGYRVCGLNNANRGGTNSGCNGAFKMLIDDWGLASGTLATGDESGNCPINPFGAPCLGNLNYWTAGAAIYAANSLLLVNSSLGADYDLLTTIVGRPWWPGGNPVTSLIPTNPTGFYMGNCGENASVDLGGACLSMFEELTWWQGDGSWWVWQASPFVMWPTYGFAFANREKCYLGKDCGSTADNP